MDYPSQRLPPWSHLPVIGKRRYPRVRLQSARRERHRRASNRNAEALQLNQGQRTAHHISTGMAARAGQNELAWPSWFEWWGLDSPHGRAGAVHWANLTKRPRAVSLICREPVQGPGGAGTERAQLLRCSAPEPLAIVVPALVYTACTVILSFWPIQSACLTFAFTTTLLVPVLDSL